MNAKRAQELQELWVELEWRRCATDETYFIQNYVYIPSEQDARGRVKFTMFDYQHDLQQLITTNRFVVSLKARQIGYTTLAMAHALWLVLFRPGANILIVSKNQDSSNKNLAQARLAYRFLPEWMKSRGPRLEADSTKGMSFVFPDGMISHMKAAASTSGVFAGETATFVIWDEAGLVEPASLQEDVLRTLLPTTDAGGSMWIISTARGAHNRFAKTYRAAKKGESRFVSFFRPWMVSPFLQCNKDCGWCSGEEGKRAPCTTRHDRMRREFADEPWRFAQEYPADDEEAFRESGRPRFVGLPPEETFEDLPYRGDLVWKDDKTLEFQFDEHGPLRLATLTPLAEGFYVIGADPSQGVGKDYASAHVLFINDDGRPEIAGYYHSNTVQPPEFASALDRLGRFFAGRQWAALLAVEDQGGQGALPINELHRHLDYPNPYMHQNPGARRSKGSRFFAFPMTVDRRRAVIDRLAKYLSTAHGAPMLDSIYPALRVELGQFVAQETMNGNIRYAADVGCHDDLVMSLAISLWILVEEGSGSPQAAPIEEKTDFVFDVGRPIREAREQAILEAEAAATRQWETISLNSGQDGLYIGPRGIYG
jgi:hypothetical protein